MGGKIYLDDNYFSGIEGHPGTRFAIDMQAGSIDPPIDHELIHDVQTNGTGSTVPIPHELDSVPLELPEKLKILFVDDDSILRRLFKRSVQRVAPAWEVREASNGETALLLSETEDFDIIFVDMYMASIEKQLLGTETVAALRNRGIKSKLCGLSANDKQVEFSAAGADTFMFKPFPCEAYELQQALCRILYPPEKNRSNKEQKVDFTLGVGAKLFV
jgi:CheY-like chemotaxis protein